jgi:acetyl-CoA carboxylase biotin carboxyl carrier protein
MTAAKTTAMHVDTALVRELAALLDATQLSEIEVQDGDRRIRVARQMTAAVSYGAPAPVTVTPAEAAPVAPADLRNHPGVVKSPIVGTAYLTPEPGAANYVSVGAVVKAGDTLLIIEAMKVMNPISAPRAGRVSQILISNEAPVEFDQPLVVIE